MSPFSGHTIMKRGPLPLLLALSALVLSAAGCGRETTAEAPPPRPVRTVIAEKRDLGQSVVLTGQILPEKESSLAFRIGGRIIERSADIGHHVEPDQVLEKLDPQNELNASRSARAALSTAQSRLEKGVNQFQRQETLLERSSRRGFCSIRRSLQRVSLGALIIALGLLVDDAMTTVDVMTSRMAAGDSKEKAATFAYQSLVFPMLTVTAAGFVPIGFAKSAAGEYTFSIFVVVTIALIVSWFVAVLFAPCLGYGY